jgi:hypothetical protein
MVVSAVVEVVVEEAQQVAQAVVVDRVMSS